MSDLQSYLRSIVRRFDTGTSAELKSNFIAISPGQIEHLRSFFLNSFLHEYDNGDPLKQAHAQKYWKSTEGQQDLEEHVIERILRDRLEYVPWLNSTLPLRDCTILEIGCGTGSSAVAFSEQGAKVVGIDPVEIAVSMSQERKKVYGLSNLSFRHMNAVDIDRNFEKGQFELIIFFASLEHMTHQERKASLQAAWKLLEPGGHLAVVEAPNRLWFFDDHTASMPFFHWLPDNIARQYLDRHNGEPATSATGDEDEMLDFMRLGRGVSYHEFELALGDLSDLRVVSDRYTFQNRQNLFRWAYFRLTRKGRYSRFIRRLSGDMHPGFFMPYLNIVLQKT